MISLFLLLSWIALMGALLGTKPRSKKPRLLLPGEVDEEFRAAHLRNDHVALVQYYRLVLQRKLLEKDEQLVRMNLAYSLTALGDYEQALLQLDRIHLRVLSSEQVALWLNNRAYTLFKLGRLDEALDHLQDAQELMVGNDDLSQDAALAACINSTRGMVFFQKGDLDRAEKALEFALRLEKDQVATQFDLVGKEGDAERTAERLFWLSEISRVRGDETDRLSRLQQAARYPLTEYGQKAVKILRPHQKGIDSMQGLYFLRSTEDGGSSKEE